MLKQRGVKTADGKWSIPAAERNKDPILRVLARVLPSRGLVLEVASGTGQHVMHFAKALSDLTWQPSDPDAELRASIALRVQEERRANVNLRVVLRIDDDFIPDMNQRLTVYRRMAAVRSETELDRLMDEVRDRYGMPPESVLNLAEYAAIRLTADRIGLESIDREAQVVVL